MAFTSYNHPTNGTQKHLPHNSRSNNNSLSLDSIAQGEFTDRSDEIDDPDNLFLSTSPCPIKYQKINEQDKLLLDYFLELGRQDLDSSPRHDYSTRSNIWGIFRKARDLE